LRRFVDVIHVVFINADVCMFQWMQFFYIVGILWIISLIFACEKFVVAGAVADWYFNRLELHFYSRSVLYECT